MGDIKTDGTSIPERLSVLEVHMDYTVKGIDDLKVMMVDHVKHPCQLCNLADEVSINRIDIMWLKRIGYVVGGTAMAGIVTLGLDKFTGIIDRILTAF